MNIRFLTHLFRRQRAGRGAPEGQTKVDEAAAARYWKAEVAADEARRGKKRERRERRQ